MNKFSSIAFGILTTAAIFSSCTKSDDTTADVIGNWVRRSDFEGVTRSEASSFVIGGKAYICAGFDGTNRLKDLWQYDPVNNFWVQKADLPGAARSSAVGFEANDKGYISTGYDGLNRLKDCWQYNPSTNTWQQKADFAGSARYDAVGFGLLGKGYISTGYDGNYLKDLWQYDPATDSWTQQVSMGGSKRSAAAAFVYNGKAYIFSGNNNGTSSTVNDMWQYDPTAATVWTEKRKISNVSDDDYDDSYAIIRSNAVTFVMNGKGYISCGENGSVLNDTWEYDFANDVWTKKTSYEGVARTGASGFAVSDRGYLLTGRSSNTAFDDIYEFFPAQDYNSND